MNYTETLEYLYAQLPMFQRIGKAAYKANLDNTHALDTYLGHPHHSFRTVHVAGTNGKGSSSHMLAAILQQAGYKVGLYTSPHLVDFRERIRVNGQMMEQSYVVDFVAQHCDFFTQHALSFFEMTVGLAFDYFRYQGVQVAVVEVGMGGRLDSTNIVQPEVALITNIGLDHTEFLGHTLAAIAGEKAGIIKPGIPVVIGQTHPETEAVFRAKAAALAAPLLFADQLRQVHYSLLTLEGKQRLRVQTTNDTAAEWYELDLQGAYQQHNLLGVLAVCDVLREAHWHINDEALRQGLAHAAHSTGLMGRWQVLAHNPLLVCDTGHNEDGIAQVLQQIARVAHRKLHWVFGMVNDKDTTKVLRMLPTTARYYFTRAALPRALSQELLAQRAAEFGLQGDCFPTVAEAIQAARQQAAPQDLVLVGGSTFVVADALVYLQSSGELSPDAIR